MTSEPQPPSWQGVYTLDVSINGLGKGGQAGWCSYGCAGLNKELSDRGTVVHGVERGDFVNTLGRHLEQAGDLVHDADAGEAVLALAEVEDGHDGSLLVLRGVSLEDLFDDGLVLLVKLERDIGIVIGRVAVLQKKERKKLARMFLSRGSAASASKERPLADPIVSSTHGKEHQGEIL